MNWRSLVATLPKSRYVNAGSQEVKDSSRVKLLHRGWGEQGLDGALHHLPAGLVGQK